MYKKETMIATSGLNLTIACACLTMSSCAEKIPPDAMTRTRMRVTQRRIIDYFSANGKLPSKLSDLPPTRGDHDTSMIDAWGRRIGYRAEPNQVILESMGRDGKPGGNGMDQDIFLVFDPSTPEMLEPFSYSPPTSPKAE
jgi:hypothetical protein